MPKRLPCTASTRYLMISGFMTIDAEPERNLLLETTSRFSAMMSGIERNLSPPVCPTLLDIDQSAKVQRS